MKLSDLKKLTQHVTITDSAASQGQVQDFLRSMGYDPSAFYQELEMDSFFVDTHRDTSYSNAQLSLHSHAFYELLYCASTCGAEYLVGTDRYRLQKGDIIFVPPGISHRPLLPENMKQPYKRYVLWLSPEFIQSFAKLLPAQPPAKPPYSTLLRTAGTKWTFLEELFLQGIRETEKQKPGWEAAVVGNTITLMTHLLRAINDRSASLTAEKPILLDRLMAYIEAHLSEHITLADTARMFYVSPSTISQLFRQKMGVSFYRCVTQRRLISAKELILSGKALEDVSRLVGFTDYSAFYRAFRQEYGISPRQFRTLQEADGRVFGKENL